jgi:uncharacterized protein with PQ loop repeat
MHILNQFVEVRQFGLNAITVALIGTFVLSLIQAWGLLHQIKRIREERSTKSVSMVYLGYFCVHFICTMVYGYRHDMLAYVLGGAVLAVMYGRVLDVAIGYGGQINMFRYIPYLILAAGAFYAMPEPYDYVLMVCFYFIGTFFVFQIPYEIIRNNSKGSVSGRMLITVASTIAFWFVYGFCVRDWLLALNCGLSLVALAIAGYLYKADGFRRQMLKPNNGNA